MIRKLRELYQYREMIVSLVRKDLKGRYKGSVLGFLWTFLNPLLQLSPTLRPSRPLRRLRMKCVPCWPRSAQPGSRRRCRR